jgi:hypothetical protein
MFGLTGTWVTTNSEGTILKHKDFKVIVCFLGGLGGGSPAIDVEELGVDQIVEQRRRQAVVRAEKVGQAKADENRRTFRP